MAVRALLVALWLAAAGLSSCGGGDSAPNADAGKTVTAGGGAPPVGAAPEAPTAGGAEFAAPRLDRAVVRADRRCRRTLGPPRPATPVSSLAERAAQVRREHARLQRISRALAAAGPRGRVPKALRRYDAVIRDQMFLDARIERAARERDTLAVEVGLRQNRFNQRRRQTLADRLGLYACR